MRTVPPLSIIGKLPVDERVQSHRFVIEASMIARAFGDRDERVIGTRNDCEVPYCQLYGWATNVLTHVDNTGWVYFVPVFGSDSIISAAGGDILASNGDVIRLNDFTPHSTMDDSVRVCLFIGPYKRPRDALAKAMLAEGLEKLASGAYSAPRVKSGFQFPASDECFVSIDGQSKIMLVDDAKAQKRVIAMCGKCGKRRAWTLDHLFPYQSELSRCERCYGTDKAARLAAA